MSRVDFDLARKIRDRRLRKKLLQAIHLSRVTATQEISGRGAMDLANTGAYGDQKFESEAHALLLLRDLVNKGLIEERTRGLRRGEAFGLEYCLYKITARGSSLYEETIPPDPDVDDERNLED